MISDWVFIGRNETCQKRNCHRPRLANKIKEIRQIILPYIRLN